MPAKFVMAPKSLQTGNRKSSKQRTTYFCSIALAETGWVRSTLLSFFCTVLSTIWIWDNLGSSITYLTRIEVRLGGVDWLKVLHHPKHLQLRFVFGFAEALVRRVDGKLLRDVVHLLEGLLHEDESDQRGKVLLREPNWNQS